MSVTWGTPISSVMTNRRRVGALKSLGMVTIGDALTYYPFRVTEPVPLCTLREAKIGEPMAFAAEIRSLRIVPMNARRGYRLEAVADDSLFAASQKKPGAVARLVFFSYKKQYVDWMSKRLKQGAHVVVCGQPTVFNDQLQFTHPEVLTIGTPDADTTSGMKFDVSTADEGLQRVCRPRPVYHASSRISSDHIHDSILGFLRLMTDNAAGSATTAAATAHATGIAKTSHTTGKGLSAPLENATSSVSHSPNEPSLLNADSPLMWQSLTTAIPDVLPESIRADKSLMHRAEAFAAVHNPQSTASFWQAISTLRYEEAFVCQTALLRSRRDATQSSATPRKNLALRDQFLASLPFDLTDGQRTVVDDIASDVARNYPMQRLLQGEVGSGKTVVAVAAMLQATGSGGQTVLVAPTQVLAEQHYQTISNMLERLYNPQENNSTGSDSTSNGKDANNVVDITNGNTDDAVDNTADDTADNTGSDVHNNSTPIQSTNPPIPPVILLTGGMRLAARRRALASIASGEPCIVVATHAAFSSTFQAPNLSLAVIDEQHRFGVEQRESLRTASISGTVPHLLVMTATPIPRTAAMTWFGDLDISWLTELPGGRKPIRTVVVPEADGNTMASMFAHIRQRIEAGERAYVVCARIDESNNDTEAEIDTVNETVEAVTDTSALPLHSVTQIAERLSKLPQFQGIQFATLTGRDDDDTKQRVMEDFASGKTPILVATTVIEVGVDVPQASCIVIFDADRFGLSQLHQLRGRVGRGGTPSWAFLVSRAEAGSLGEQRLSVIRDTTDGAQIAEADLQLRGAGDVLGDAQSGGRSSLKLLRVVQDAHMIADARERAQTLLSADPDLSHEVELAGAVLDFTRGNETFLTSN